MRLIFLLDVVELPKKYGCQVQLVDQGKVDCCQKIKENAFIIKIIKKIKKTFFAVFLLPSSIDCHPHFLLFFPLHIFG
jgi:hypothetical protein